jgi:hypothetical protein
MAGMLRIGVRREWYAGGDVRDEKRRGGRCTWRERCVSAFSVVGDVGVDGGCTARRRVRSRQRARLSVQVKRGRPNWLMIRGIRRTTAGTRSIGVDASGAYTPGVRTQNYVGSEGRGGIRLKRAYAGGDVRNGRARNAARKQKAWTRGGAWPCSVPRAVSSCGRR